MQSSTIENLGSELLEKVRSYSAESSLERLRKALEFAKQAHQGQLRKSGEPYIIHPLRTVLILTNLHVDEDTLIAGLLHDVPEDTSVSLSEIEKNFGPKIKYLVDGITKLTKVHYREAMEQRQIESLKKLFIHSAEDLRVILIKLADRLDNMRTLRFIAEEKKRKRIARETLEIYVPIANLLSIGELRAELEDLCFEHLYPREYAMLKGQVEENLEERTFILEEMMHLAEKELKKNGMECEIIGRQKTYSSIYRKLQVKGALNNVDDLIAIRVIVPTRKDCYHTLGIIHNLFKPRTSRFKDYIAVPKPNAYQSLHTAVFGINSSVVEFQIRTRYMHLEAEYGIAAHYFYKYADEAELASIMKQRSSWVQRILEIQKEHKDPEHFIENLKLDVFQDRIFAFTPKGDVIDLPRGACAIDFAYAIHSDVGNHSIKAEINGKVVPVITALVTGDTINIITNKHTRPEREWLNFAKTSLAIYKIKEYLKHSPIEVKRQVGKRFLQKEFDRIGQNFVEELTSKRMAIIGQKLPYKTLDDLLIGVGDGTLDPQKILEILYEQSDLTTASSYFIHKRNIRKSGFLSRVRLQILGDNSTQQFREIFRTLNALDIPVVKFIIDRPWYMKRDRCVLTVYVKNYNELAQIFETLEQLDGIEKVSRLFILRQAWFWIMSAITAAFWLSHPLLLYLVLMKWSYADTAATIVLYGGIAMLFQLVFSLKNMARRSFPELAETTYYWLMLYGLTTLALFTVIGEIIKFKFVFNWVFVIGLIVGIYALLTASYVTYKKEQLSVIH